MTSRPKEERFSYALYNALLVLGSPLALLAVILRYPKTFLHAGLEGIGMRLGSIRVFRAPDSPKPVWFHAASLGECRAAVPLIRAFRRAHPRVPVVFSSTTPNGAAEARRLGLSDSVFYAPLDFPWSVRSALASVDPQMLLLLESELWPNLLRIARERGAVIGVVNGRISQRSTGRYLKISGFIGSVLSKVDFLCAREEGDAERFAVLGLPRDRIRVSGNLKYDLLPGDLSEKDTSRPLWPQDRPVLVAGSVREGEEEQVLRALDAVRSRRPELRLVLAPRHLENIGGLTQRLDSHGLRWSLKTKLEENPDWDVLVWDSFGDLWTAYREATVVFMGGSLVGKGGQNPIEPAWFSKAVLFGPSMENFAEPADALLKSGGAFQVRDAEELAARVEELLADAEKRRRAGENARRAMDAISGRATRATLEAIESRLKA